MVFKLVEGLIEILNYHGTTIIDSSVFRLHYRWTSTMLFLACILLTAGDIIGKPIACMDTKQKKVEDWVLNYCWMTSTYILDVVGIQEDLKGDIGGLGSYDSELHETIYHAYYQWVPFVLFGMGCFFQIPHMIWMEKEGNTVDKLLQGLDRNSVLDQSTEKVEHIVRYIQASKGINGHYFYYYIGLEFLNFLNVLAQMYFLDTFIGGQFWYYGLESMIKLLSDENKRQDPMMRTFPRITKCKFSFYGPSGTIEDHDKMCLLPQNMLNEKIFLIIWIWFIILTTITLAYVVMRLVLLLTPILNAQLEEEENPKNDDALLEGAESPANDNAQNRQEDIEMQSRERRGPRGPRGATVKERVAKLKFRTLDLGDYCLLELLQVNLDYAIYQAILKKLQGNYLDPFPGFLWLRPISLKTLND